jgi:GT2 family glycosyltransferase
MRLLRRARHALEAAVFPHPGSGRFELRAPSGRLPSGWVALDFRIGGNLIVAPRLLVDEGNGFSEAGALPLPFPGGGRLRAIVELPRDVRRLALEVGDVPPSAFGSLSAVELGTVEIAARLALPVIRRRLAEPWTIPISALRLGRALFDGTLLRRLSQKESHEAPQLRYPEWHRRYAALSDADRAAIRAAIARLDRPPRFSLVAPQGERTLRSIRAQLYQNYEVCDALEKATGDFVLRLDAGDELAEHALYLYADALCAHRDADLVYGDEDRADDAGLLYDPDFKPDWNPDLLLSQDYLGHAVAVRVTAARRGQEFFSAGRALHVPFVVNHRHLPDAPASLGAAQRHVGEAAIVENGPLPGTRRLRWKLPEKPPLVSLIIPTRDRRELLEACVESLLSKTGYRNFEVLVVDNDSRDPAALDYLASLERRGVARVLRDLRPFNFPALNNLAVAQARGEVVGLLNNDLEIVEAGWLEEMVSHALRPEVGAVGARLLYPDRTVQHAGVILGIGGIADHGHKQLSADAPGYRSRAKLTQDLSAVTAACLLIRKETYLAVGGLDEEYAVAFNDVDFCLRLRERGLRNVWTPFATLVHHESKSRGRETTPWRVVRFRGEMARLRARWGKALLNDPAYNPNLTLDATNFSLAWPPRARPPWR